MSNRFGTSPHSVLSHDTNPLSKTQALFAVSWNRLQANFAVLSKWKRDMIHRSQIFRMTGQAKPQISTQLSSTVNSPRESLLEICQEWPKFIDPTNVVLQSKFRFSKCVSSAVELPEFQISLVLEIAADSNMSQAQTSKAMWYGLTQIDSVQNMLGSKLYVQLHNLPSCRYMVGLHKHRGFKEYGRVKRSGNAKHCRQSMKCPCSAWESDLSEP